MALTDQVIMPGSDYQGICDQTRRITGETGILKSGEVVTKLSSVPAGGGGGGAVYPKDINFYDYDGTCVAAWSLAELAGKTALPDYPTHEGLTCQGWNWTLADLKAENAKMNVGAMYITSDGKTRIYITLQEGRTSPMLGIRLEGTVTVDWGDNTTPDTLTGTNIIHDKWTPTHNYAAPGDYVITLTVNDGTFGINGNNGVNLLRYTSGSDNRNYAYWNAIQRIFLGSGITTIYSYAFQNCYSLASITLPRSVTGIGTYAFQNCNSLAQITIPSGITSINQNAFQNCYSMAHITIPSGVTSISQNAFQNCRSMDQITIPSGVTNIGNSAFQQCGNIAQITLPSSVTGIGNSAFIYCSSLAQITIPSGVTNIGNSAFQDCYSLAQITIPSGITSINQNTFQTCYSMAHITIPSSVTSIGNYAFYNCYSMAFYDFTACTAVPTLSNSSAFTNIPADCEIRVPAALLDEWKAATNWVRYKSYIVGV